MIQLERNGPFFTLTLCDGENRFSLEMLRTFDRMLDEIVAAAGNEPAALIVTGQGKYWSNGIDLEWLQRAAAVEQAAFLPALDGLLRRLLTFPLPTAAALNGHAFAGGAILALVFDYRVMRQDRGWFCLPEIDLQIPFPPFMLALLREKLAPHVLRDAVLGGKRYTAAQALQAHIVDDVCASEELVARTRTLLAPLAEKSRPTYARFKHDLYGELARAATDLASGDVERTVETR